MMKSVAATIVVAVLMAATAVAQSDPCTLLTAAEVTSALGSAPGRGTPKGPRTEKGGTSRTCTQPVGKSILTVNVVEFASAAGADQGIALVLKEAQDIPEAFKLEPATGVGDRSAFGTNPMGAMWVAIKGKYMLAITVMGESANPSQLRDPLKRLTTAGLTKLAP
jgi:hypothetical protein